MSTDQKDDAVISFVKTYLVKNPDSHVAKLFLYADPNSGYLDAKKHSTYESLRSKCSTILLSTVNGSHKEAQFNYEGMERPLSAVSITVRVRHVINNLSFLRNLVDTIKLVYYIKLAKGEEWPVYNDNEKYEYPRLKIPVLKSMYSAINKALTGELPTFIDEVYKAKYKSSGSFTYSLAETKLFTMDAKFVHASLEWIKTLDCVKQVDASGYILRDQNGSSLRDTFVWNQWFNYVKDAKSGNVKMPEFYENLASAIVARVGKLKYEAPPVVDERPHAGLSELDKQAAIKSKMEHDMFLSQRSNCLAFFGLIHFKLDEFYSSTVVNGAELKHSFDGVPDVKKKYFQTKLYDHLMNSLIACHVQTSEQTGYGHIQNKSEFYPPEYKSRLIQNAQPLMDTLDRACDALGIERALVYMDTLKSYMGSPYFSTASQGPKRYFTVNDINVIANHLSSGVVNDRIMNTIARFISCTSLSDSASTRKKIPTQIEAVLVEKPDVLLKVKVNDASDPSIVLSTEALMWLQSQHDEKHRSVLQKFAHLRDKTNPGVTGFVQRGVMSLGAALKTGDDAPANLGVSEEMMKFLINEFREMAVLYQMSIAPILEQRKKANNEILKNQRVLKKLGLPVGNTSVSSYASPSVMAMSPGQQGGIFGAPAESGNIVPMAPVGSSRPASPARAQANFFAPASQPAPAAPAGFGAPAPAASVQSQAAPAGFGAPAPSGFGNIPIPQVKTEQGSRSSSPSRGAPLGAGGSSPSRGAGAFGAGGSSPQAASLGLFGPDDSTNFGI